MTNLEIQEFDELFKSPSNLQDISYDETLDEKILNTCKNGNVCEYLQIKLLNREILFDKKELANYLEYAVYGQNKEMVKYLVEVEGIKPTYETCLITIDTTFDVSMLEYLLHQVEPPALLTHEAVTPTWLIYAATTYNDVESLKILARHGINS